MASLSFLKNLFLPEHKSVLVRLFDDGKCLVGDTARAEAVTAARAIENQLFVVSCNACGERDGTVYGGFSRVIDPLGTVLVQGGGEEGILSTALDLSCICPLRAAVPVFHDRRPELYRL